MFWNAWAEDLEDGDPTFDRVAILAPGVTYRFVVHLAGIEYFSSDETSATTIRLSPLLADRIRRLNKAKRPSLVLRPILLTDSELIATPSQVLPDDLVVDLSKMRAYFGAPRPDPPDDALNYLKDQAGDATFVFGRMKPFELSTQAAAVGWTAIGIAFSDPTTGMPIDELSIPICISNDPAACSKRPRPMLTLATGSVLDLAGSISAASPPQGTLHIVQVDRRIIGIFARNRDGNVARVTDYVIWKASADSDDFLSRLKNKQYLFASSRDDVTAVGVALRELLFPSQGGTEVSSARTFFEQFVNEVGGSAAPYSQTEPPSVFVRMILHDITAPALYPLGLLSMTNDPLAFVGYRFRIDTPLPRQIYSEQDACVANWRFVLPIGNEDTALGNAYGRIRDRVFTTTSGSESFKLGTMLFRVDNHLPSVRTWINPDPEPPPSPADPVVLAILSHHASGSVRLSGSSAIDQDNVTRDFQAPAVAILSSCSSAVIGDTGFLRALNSHGVETVLATNTSISGAIAGDWINCLAKTIEAVPSGNSIEAAAAFASAQKCLYDMGYGATTLSFSYAGNPRVRFCGMQ